MMPKMFSSRPYRDCFYIEVKNLGAFSAIFFVGFLYQGKREFLKSPPIESDFKAKLCVPMTSTNVILTIDIFLSGELKNIYDRYIFDNNNHCFIVMGTYEFVTWREVVC